MIETVTATLLALSGGLVAWIAGRRVLRHCDEPDFSTRHFRHRVRMIRIWAALAVAICFVAPRAALANLPLFYLAVAAGSFPSRKRIYEEQWGFGEYLLDRVRLVVFAGGFWLALIAEPQIINALGQQWSIVVVAALSLWFASYQEFLAFALHAAPMNEALVRDLEPVLAASTAPRPRLLEGGARNGRFVNALALPNGKWSSVLISRAALDNLTGPEIKGVFAHELAHIEQFNDRGMRWRQILGWLLIPTFGALPLVLAPGDSMTAWWPVIWPVVLTLAMTIVLTQRQKNETLADLRALKLGADPEALISGLEKIHDLNKLPRRFDPAIEKQMSHPSLALRIAAIRKEAGLEPLPTAALPRFFPLRQKGNWARFDAEMLTVYGGVQGDPVADSSALETAASAKSWRISALSAVHFAQTLGGPEIRARSGNEKIRLAVEKKDAIAANEVLETIGVSVTTEAAQTAESPTKRRLVAAVALFLSLLPGISFALTAASFVALITASAPAMAAMGFAAIAAGAYSLFSGAITMLDEIQPLFAALTAVFGLLAAILAFSMKQEQKPRGLAVTVAILGVALAVAAIPFVLAIGDDPLTRIFLAARQRPSVTILLISIAAAILVSGRSRKLAGLTTAAAVCTLLIGLPIVGERLAADALIASSEPEWVVNSAPVASHRAAGYPVKLELSPDGRAIGLLTATTDDGEPNPGGSYAVGPIGGPAKEIEAQAITFIDSRRLLAVRKISDTQLQVEEIDLATGATTPGPLLPAIYNVELRVERNGRWSVAGMDFRTHAPIRFSGVSGSTAYEVARWNVKSSYMGGISWSGSDPEIVYADFPAESSTQAGLLGMLGGRAYPTTIWRTDGKGRQKIGKTLLKFVRVIPVPGSPQYVIAASDANSVHISSWSAADRQLKRHGMIEATGFTTEVARGSRIAVPNQSGEVVVWNLATGKAMNLVSEGVMAMPLDLALGDRHAAVLWMRDGDMVVDVYSTDVLD